jgi:hypothetical protein
MIVSILGVCLVAVLGLVGQATRRAYDRTASAVAVPGHSGYPAGGGTFSAGPPSGRHGSHRPPEPPDDSLAARPVRIHFPE